jgi:hypothetical protein
MSFWPQPNAPGALNFIFNAANSDVANQYNARIDFNISERHRLFGRFSVVKNSGAMPDTYGNIATIGWDQKTNTINGVLDHSWTVSPSFPVNLRYGFTRQADDRVGYSLGTDITQYGWLQSFSAARQEVLLPEIRVTNYLGLSRGTLFKRSGQTHAAVANLSKIFGRQSLKFGGEFRAYQQHWTDNTNASGNFNFNTGFTRGPNALIGGGGSEFASFLLGYMSSGSLANIGSISSNSPYYALYLQDDIRVNQSLTLNLGLRWEAEMLPYSITHPDKNQWAPRLGFAWRPFGEATVLRGGYGIFFEGEYTDSRVNLFMPPFLLRETALADRAAVPTRTLQNFFLGTRMGASNTTVDLTPTYTRLNMGYDQHWNFGIQQQIARSMVFDIEYVGNKGTHIQGQDAFNIPEPGPGSVAARRPFPRFGPFNYISSDVSTTYHAMQAKLERRLSAGLWFLASYTFAKSLWRSNTPAAGGRYQFERGPSEFHVPHTLALSYGYELPIGRGKPLLGGSGRVTNAVLGGWQMQGILIFRNGVPFTPTVSRDVANTGVGTQRPNRIASGKLDDPTLERWFDVAAFAVAPNFTYGNAGLRILYPDIVRTIDFSMFKNFEISENSRLQFRWEVFNLPNTPSFAAPNSTIDGPTVGRVTTTSTDPRQMQVALKYTF